MGGLDTEVCAEDGVTPALNPERRPHFGAAHALGVYLFIFVSQWMVGYGVVSALMFAAAATGKNLNDQRMMNDITAQSIAPILFLALVVSAFFTFLSLHVFARHLVRDRTPAGLGLFVPPARSLVLWSAIGLALATGHAVAMKFIAAFAEPSAMSILAAQTTVGHVAWVTTALVSPLLWAILYEGLIFCGMAQSWGVKAASVVLVLLYVGSSATSATNWSTFVVALVFGVAAVWARLQTGSLVASFALTQVYIVVFTIAYYAFLRVTPNP